LGSGTVEQILQLDTKLRGGGEATIARSVNQLMTELELTPLACFIPDEASVVRCVANCRRNSGELTQTHLASDLSECLCAP
jgi:hypothetical protein